jgi:hypothetical protein
MYILVSIIYLMLAKNVVLHDSHRVLLKLQQDSMGNM